MVGYLSTAHRPGWGQGEPVFLQRHSVLFASDPDHQNFVSLDIFVFYLGARFGMWIEENLNGVVTQVKSFILNYVVLGLPNR